MDKADPAVLQALFDLPPEDAIAHLEKKGLAVTFNWAEMLDEAHARAFTVAKAMQLDVLQVIRKGVLDAVAQGKTLKQFSDELEPLLRAKGWWGKQTVVDDDGTEREVQLGSLHRLRTIYQTNLQSAYMAGRFKAQMQADAFPWLMYVAVMDSRTRPSHAALNGKVWRKDDPVWSSIYPPNGFNCRCRTRALTDGQMKREGLRPSDPPEITTREVSAGVDKVTGEEFRTVQTGVRVKDARGQTVTMWTDPGFNSSPLASHVIDEVLTQKAIEALGDEAAFELVREVLLSAPRVKAWEAFVDGSYRNAGAKALQRQTMTVGLLPLDAVQLLAADDKIVSPVLSVRDALVAGRKALRHEAAGNALTQDQWADLPAMLSNATWYLDKRSKNVVAVMDGGIDTVVKIAFYDDGSAASAFLVPSVAVEGAVKGGQWRALTGGRGT